MILLDVATLALLLASAVFFAAGTLGLLRFPDTFSRLHALTKADNLGLGLVVAALVVQAGGAAEAAKLVLIWGLTMFVGSSASYLVARHALRHVEREEPEP